MTIFYDKFFMVRLNVDAYAKMAKLLLKHPKLTVQRAYPCRVVIIAKCLER